MIVSQLDDFSYLSLQQRGESQLYKAAQFPFLAPQRISSGERPVFRKDPYSWENYPLPKRIDIGHIEGKGIGYTQGYSHLSMILGPEYHRGHFLPLISMGAQVFNDRRWGANLGFIGRYLPRSLCEVFGFTVFYNFREGKLGSYHQIGGGFEVLNKRWEIHTKGLIPVGAKRHSRPDVFDDYVGPFRFVSTRTEFAFYALDVNAGYYLVNGKHFQLYASAGPYYLSGEFDKKSWGGKVLVRPQYQDSLFVELSMSHDRIFNTIYQINVIFSLPLYQLSSRLKNKKGPCGMSNRQVYQPIDPDIILDRECCCHANF